MQTMLDLLGTYGLFLGIPLLFLLIVAWIFRPGSAKGYLKDASIPFEADKPASSSDAASPSLK